MAAGLSERWRLVLRVLGAVRFLVGQCTGVVVPDLARIRLHLMQYWEVIMPL